MQRRSHMRVALVHDWLVGQRGGENVLLELARMYPDAPIYTLVHVPGRVHPELESKKIVASFVQNLPGAPQLFRPYLPLFPTAVERWDFSEFDLVISTSHCVAKGIMTSSRQTHISYVHTPMRYLWDQMPQYLNGLPFPELVLPAAKLATLPLRRWDVRSAQRPDVLVANSRYVAERIRRVWGRAAHVIYPPVDGDYFSVGEATDRKGYLVVSALVPYKRVDMAVRLATRASIELTVMGDGSERARLEAMAGPTVRFLGPVSRDELRRGYKRARGLLFCGVEDFGIVPLEAQAAGCPVVALAEGGALETVLGSGGERTGVFFHEPTEDALEAAIAELELGWLRGSFTEFALQRHAAGFTPEQFTQCFSELVERTMNASLPQPGPQIASG